VTDDEKELEKVKNDEARNMEVSQNSMYWYLIEYSLNIL
jgi:hypothetical protein